MDSFPVPRLRVKRVVPSAVLPIRATEGAAAYDLCVVEAAILSAGETKALSTGLSIAIAPGFYGRLVIRSGFANRLNILLNAGTLDSDYRGVVHLVVSNIGTKLCIIHAGDRIGQMIIERCYTPVVEEVASLEDTARGSGGFGSTGTTVKDLPSVVAAAVN